ncbi:hypothetical protein [Bacillus toyonensis]|nr:hypothetical protein [Bacillus toyonensis]
MERIEANEELIEDMRECFVNGTSLRCEVNDFNVGILTYIRSEA